MKRRMVVCMVTLAILATLSAPGAGAAGSQRVVVRGVTKTSITVGGVGESVICRDDSPISAVSSSFTIFTTCWPGSRLSITSWPSARSLTASVNCLTTRKLTSASSSASRISRIALLTSSSLSFPRERTSERADCSLSERVSNMGGGVN